MIKRKGLMEREEQIRQLAYSIWEQEGYPEGRAVDHWLKAEMIVRSDPTEPQSEKKIAPAKPKKPRKSRASEKRISH